jgi:hypothetical protein
MFDLTFEVFLSPYERAFFLEDVLGKTALYVEGSPTKFRTLFSWSALNHLMTYGGFGYPRIRLMNGSEELPAELYLRTGSSGYPRPNVRAIYTALNGGATLAVESIHELHEPISLTCEILEREIAIPVQADLYACWNDKVPSAVRWNEHDVIVIQIEGSRVWRIHGPTASHPTTQYFPPEPMGDPIWQGELRQGNLIYIPKGWWYCDHASEPGLYLGIKFRRPSTADVLRRMFDLLTRSPEMRMDCPRAPCPEAQNAFLRTFQQEIFRESASPGLLLGFWKDFPTMAEPRISFNFPWSVSDLPLPPSNPHLPISALLRFPSTDCIRHVVTENAVDVIVGGECVRFTEEVGAILERLCVSPPLSVNGLLEAFAGRMTPDQVLSSLAELIRQGLVGTREPFL